jgi:hypothetical protein
MKSADELDKVSASAGVRRVGERLFTLSAGVWTDSRHSASLRTVAVQPYSAAYFELMQRIEQLAPVFALGDRLIVAGRNVAIELNATGAARLSASEIAALVRDW